MQYQNPPLGLRQPRLRHLLRRQFDELPDHIRHQGPWQGMQRGEIDKLKANYRRGRSRATAMLS